MTVPPLSQAILLGIGAVKDIRAPFFYMDKDGPCGCAIGTALFVVGRPENATAITRLKEIWPWTGAVTNPDYGCIAHEISSRHFRGESRESIAAWLATIEPLPAPPAGVRVEEEVEA